MLNDQIVASLWDIDAAWSRQQRAHCLGDDPDIGSNARECAAFPTLGTLLPIPSNDLKQLIVKHGQQGCGGTLYLRGARIQGHLNLEGLSACNGASLPRLYLIQCLFEDGISFKGAHLAHISLRGSRFGLERTKPERKFGDPVRHILGDNAVVEGDVDLSQIRPLLVQPAKEDEASDAGQEPPLPKELDNAGSRSLLLSLQGALIRGALRTEHTTFAETKEAKACLEPVQPGKWYAVDLSAARICGAMRLTPRLVVHGGVRATGLRCDGEAWVIGSRLSRAYVGESEGRPYRHAITFQSAVFHKSLFVSQDLTSPHSPARSIITGQLFLYACTVGQQLVIEGITLRFGGLDLSASKLGALSITNPDNGDPRSKFSGTSTAKTEEEPGWDISTNQRLPASIGQCRIQVEPGTIRNVILANATIGRLELSSTERSGPTTDSIKNVYLTNATCEELKIGGIIEEVLDLSGAKISGDCVVACSVPRAHLNDVSIGGSLDLRKWSTREMASERQGTDHKPPQVINLHCAGDLPQLDVQNARIGSRIDVAEFRRIRAQKALQARLNCYPGYKIVLTQARIEDGDESPMPKDKDAFLAFLERSEGGVLRLDGSSSVFHTLNQREPPELETEAQVIEYITLFCAFTWADGGPFRVFTRDSVCPDDLKHFVEEDDGNTACDIVEIIPASIRWKRRNGESVSWSDGPMDSTGKSVPVKILASPKAYRGLSQLEAALKKGDFSDILLLQSPTEKGSRSDGDEESSDATTRTISLNTWLKGLCQEYRVSKSPTSSNIEVSQDTGPESPVPETDAWFVVSSIWYHESIFTCLFQIEQEESQVNVAMLEDCQVLRLAESETSEDAPDHVEHSAGTDEPTWLPVVPLQDYQAFELRNGGQAALVTLEDRDDDSCGDEKPRLNLEQFLGSPFTDHLEPYCDTSREASKKRSSSASGLLMTSVNRWWQSLICRLSPSHYHKRDESRARDGRERALWKGWGWSRQAYVDLSGSRCRVLADVSGRGWGDSIYFKTDRFEFETVVRKEFSSADGQQRHSPGKKLRMILNEFTWKGSANAERIDYTNEPNMSYYEQRLLWLSRYRMNEQSALDTPDSNAKALTDSAEEDLNRWFEPGTFRSFARVYRERSLDQGAAYLDESLMRLKSWHLRWHLRHLDQEPDGYTTVKRLLAGLAILVGGLMSFWSGLTGWAWGLIALGLLFVVWRPPLTKFAMRGVSVLLFCWDTVFRWGFRYGLSLVRPLVTVMVLLIMGWWSVNYLDSRGFMVVETMFVANQVDTQQEMPVFSTATGPFKPVTNLTCGSNIDHALYALDKLIPLIEIDQDHRCLIRPFDANLGDVAYSAVFTHPWYRGQAPGCESDDSGCHLLYPLEIITKHPTTWRILQAIYVLLGWIIISATLLTFSGVLRKHAEGS